VEVVKKVTAKISFVVLDLEVFSPCSFDIRAGDFLVI
jgi:hypothetical protein